MWIGNLMLVMLNLPLVGLWVRLLKVPYRLPVPRDHDVLRASAIYSINNSSFDVYLAAIFGVLGLLLAEAGVPEPAPLLLGFVLGPLMEENLRRAMLISRGDPTVFFTRPISLGFMIATILIIVAMGLPMIKKRREQIVD